MSTTITGKANPLYEIFSSHFEYFIPNYQRPYSWNEDNIKDLFTDLYDSWQNGDSDYFLGSIVLIKEEKKRKSEVIDGQQRLTSLTILLSVIAYFLPEEDKDEIKNLYIMEKGKKYQGILPNQKLHLRNIDNDFFKEYIQNININDLLELNDIELKTESQKQIRDNAKKISILINETFNGQLENINNFLQFIIQNCYLITVSTTNLQSAFKIFNILNSRGMDLLATDILKSKLIGEISKEEQDKYSEIWENIENETTREEFEKLFSHIKTIYSKSKGKKELIDEFEEFVVKGKNAKEVINNILVPYSEAYNIIKSSQFYSTEKAEEINYLLRWLNKINNSDWIPVAIKFFTEYKNDENYLYDFLFKLERLAAILMITGKDVNYRIRRFSEILSEMEIKTNHNINSPLVSLELNEYEKKDFIQLLDSDIYHLIAYKRNYLILRIDSFVSSANRNYDDKILSIEHILPQTISENSEWLELWPNEAERNNWTHKLANLVPLPKRHNSSASNKPFNEKKHIYLDTKGKCADYALTIQALDKTEWSPVIVETRQKELIETIFKNWNL